MKIGEALRKERLNLNLTQQQMCEGILSRPFYAKVEKDIYRINSESLIQILLKNKIDIVEFYDLLKDTYDTSENILNNKFQIEMNKAVSSKNIKALENRNKEILSNSNNEILKLRSIVTVSYFKGELDKLDPNIREKLKKEFDEGKHWVNRPELLQLFANTMPLWSQDELNFFVNRLLVESKKNKNISELMLERYLRIFTNYLVTCYERKIYQNRNYAKYINNVIEYTLSVTSSYHLILYRITIIYIKLLLIGNKEKARQIKKEMIDCGYKNLILSWPV